MDHHYHLHHDHHYHLHHDHHLLNIQDAELDERDGCFVLNGRKLNKAESILNGLLHSGNYDNIIQNIFQYLNATQLACLQKVLLTTFTICNKTIDI